MECKAEINKQNCTCTENCSNRGICCQCIAYHRSHNQLPGCYFSKEQEATKDRSIENFIRHYKAQYNG